MIEIGSFIGLAAMTQSEITIKNCRIDMLGIIPEIFRRMGIKLEFRGDDIHIPSQERYEIETFIDGSILTVSDAPWPGFTPDLISIVLVDCNTGKRNRPHPPEDVRKPPLLRGQTYRYGCADHLV